MADRVLVLGGSTGIGQEVAALLADGGFDGKMRPVTAIGMEDFEIMDREALGRAIRESKPTHVVYSIGINRLDWISDIQYRDFSRVMDVNVAGFISTIQALKEIVGPCSVVAVTSDAAWRPMRTSMVYCASKAALEMCVKVASRELAPEGWRINAVAPGKVTDTPMTDYVDARVMEIRGWTQEQAQAYEDASSALGRGLSRVEVARTIAAVLLSPAEGWTGAVIGVNGGR